MRDAFVAMPRSDLVSVNVGGSEVKSKTGSYVASQSAQISAALAHEMTSGVFVGALIEGALSDYDTHNDFYNGTLDGSGTSKYLGLGLFSVFESDLGYIDLALRGGAIKSTFSTDLLSQELKMSRLYYGGVAEVGVNLGFGFEIYARSAYTSVAADELKVGEALINIDKISSLIAHGGVRFRHKFGKKFGAFVTLGAEREFIGETSGKNSEFGGYSVNSEFKTPSMQGNSALGELGFAYAPSANFSLNLKANARAGQNEGFGANLGVVYRF